MRTADRLCPRAHVACRSLARRGRAAVRCAADRRLAWLGNALTSYLRVADIAERSACCSSYPAFRRSSTRTARWVWQRRAGLGDLGLYSSCRAGPRALDLSLRSATGRRDDGPRLTVTGGPLLSHRARAALFEYGAGDESNVPGIACCSTQPRLFDASKRPRARRAHPCRAVQDAAKTTHLGSPDWLRSPRLGGGGSSRPAASAALEAAEHAPSNICA